MFKGQVYILLNSNNHPSGWAPDAWTKAQERLRVSLKFMQLVSGRQGFELESVFAG